MAGTALGHTEPSQELSEVANATTTLQLSPERQQQPQPQV